jgi:hypothetical protein
VDLLKNGTLTYGKGNATGEVYMDDVYVGGYKVGA